MKIQKETLAVEQHTDTIKGRSHECCVLLRQSWRIPKSLPGITSWVLTRLRASRGACPGMLAESIAACLSTHCVWRRTRAQLYYQQICSERVCVWRPTSNAPSEDIPHERRILWRQSQHIPNSLQVITWRVITRGRASGDACLGTLAGPIAACISGGRIRCKVVSKVVQKRVCVQHERHHQKIFLIA